MGKKARAKTRTQHATSATGEAASGGVGPRQPCPCGSGRRYKACHGSGTPAPRFVKRPFAGLEAERDLVALREFVPAATAPIRLRPDAPAEVLAAAQGRDLTWCTLLPGATPGQVREDGSVRIATQVQHSFGDASRELAAVLLAALEAEPGTPVLQLDDPGEGPRLQDLITGPLEVELHDGFGFWLEDGADPSAAALIEQVDETVVPTRRLAGVQAAYWVSTGDRDYLRWVRGEDEERLLDALAVLHAGGRDHLGAGDRLIGMFRAHGLLVPVWEFPAGTGPEALAEGAAALDAVIAETLAEERVLSTEERAARSGLANRQLTLR